MNKILDNQYPIIISVMNKNINPMIYSDITPSQQDKIIKLCTTYGLNQEETKQLISQLRIGDNLGIQCSNDTFTPQDRKLVSIMSAKNQDMSFNDSDFKFQSEYSFKPCLKNGIHGIQSQEHSFQKALISKMKDEDQKFQELRAYNQLLIQEKSELQNKVNMLLEMKSQQSDIIVGLKNAVCTLTSLLKDKQQAYVNLHQNYQKLCNTLQQNTTRDYQQTVQKEHRRIQQRSSKELIPTQNQMNVNFQRKQSKELSKTRSSTNIIQKTQNSSRPSLKLQQNIPDNRDLKQKGFAKKQKLDMSKYKVFIDELKNICANKPQRL